MMSNRQYDCLGIRLYAYVPAGAFYAATGTPLWCRTDCMKL